MRPGVRLAPLSLGRLALLARGLVSLARRSTGIFGRLWRQIEFGAQFGVVGAQRFDFPRQAFDRFRLRKNEPDKRFLIERIKRLAIHSQLTWGVSGQGGHVQWRMNKTRLAVSASEV